MSESRDPQDRSERREPARKARDEFRDRPKRIGAVRLAVTALLVLGGAWYTFVLVALPRSSHYPYDTMTQAKRTLEDLALAAGEMDEATFLDAYFEPRQKVSMGGTTYHISYAKDGRLYRFTAVPQPPVYSSSLTQKLFFLDFTRIEYPTYAIDSESRVIQEQRTI